ncbi:hypothetical protein GA0061098_1006181 [Bradyrhizobium shewense]|uniref:Uncharacterized protein n=1 Tax=Bradyrhizobium shewense TaxID=1761772 RepID=A0A1C3W1V4_9BRAD|nr:hypothetical protein GA0061098_1006181 [Bradyrhizobium shewense]
MSNGSERTSNAADRKPVRRSVKLPGESRHSECSDSPAVIARKLMQAKREKRLRATQRNG